MDDKETPIEENPTIEFPMTQLSVEAINFWMKSVTAQLSFQKQNNLLLRFISWQLYSIMIMLGLILGALIVHGIFIK